MGRFANVKSAKLIRALQHLHSQRKIVFVLEGKHSKVSIPSIDRSYPIPTKHTEVNKNIVRVLAQWFETNGVCTASEFEEMIK